MRDFFARSFSSSRQESSDNLIARVRDNLREAFRPVRWIADSANGAPLHFLHIGASPRSGRAQGASFLTHAGVLVVIAVLAIHPPRHGDPAPGESTRLERLKFLPNFESTESSAHPDPGNGIGGGRMPLAPTAGELAHTSAIQIVRPTLPPEQEPNLPVAPTILDPNAAAVLTPVDRIGLPWMRIQTNSTGPGGSDTVGNGRGPSMGTGTHDGPGGGDGTPGKPYQAGTTYPSCLYCPNPGYTEEARESKLQGTMTVLVLVGADGRATEVRVAKGLGFGLDEHAREAVRTWRFAPARDPARHPVAMWITVEVVFRLF